MMTDLILAQPHFIYVLQVPSGEIKIGIAQDVKSRVAKLQTGNHQKISIVYSLEVADRQSAFVLEALLHRRYASDVINREWFSTNAQQLIEDINFAVEFASIVRRVVVGEPEQIEGDVFMRLPPNEQLALAIEWAAARESISQDALKREFKLDSKHTVELLRALFKSGKFIPIEGANREWRYEAR
jgi:predicted GIY-YIG superfamily endonuclease